MIIIPSRKERLQYYGFFNTVYQIKTSKLVSSLTSITNLLFKKTTPINTMETTTVKRSLNSTTVIRTVERSET